MNAASIMRRWRARSPSSGGAQMCRATDDGNAPAARVAAQKGATTQRLAWAGNHIGFEPFPTRIADEMREEHRRRVLGE